jgi:hypothetical protein
MNFWLFSKISVKSTDIHLFLSITKINGDHKGISRIGSSVTENVRAKHFRVEASIYESRVSS